MIFLMTGTPGSGKSLHMAESIYYWLRAGKRVVCNFEINKDVVKNAENFTLLENHELTPKRLLEISRQYFGDKPVQEGKIRLYIDECQILYNSRTWNEKTDIAGTARADWIKFFTQHRKLGYDVYLVTQYDNMIDKQIRALVEYEIKHRKLNNIGWVGKLASVLMLGHPVIVGVMYWYPMKQRLKAYWYFGRRKFYRMYDTYLVFEGSQLDDSQQALPA